MNRKYFIVYGEDASILQFCRKNSIEYTLSLKNATTGYNTYYAFFEPEDAIALTLMLSYHLGFQDEKDIILHNSSFHRSAIN